MVKDLKVILENAIGNEKGQKVVTKSKVANETAQLREATPV